MPTSSNIKSVIASDTDIPPLPHPPTQKKIGHINFPCGEEAVLYVYMLRLELNCSNTVMPKTLIVGGHVMSYCTGCKGYNGVYRQLT
jgi:hypothetical protein